MTGPTRDSDLPLWLRPLAVLAVIALLLAIRFYVAGAAGLVRDEAYYALWSLHPQLGYIDHPPLIAWAVGLSRLVSDSPLGVRLLSTLSTAITSLAVYRTGRLLFDARTAGLAVIWLNLTLALGLLFLATPDGPVVMFWALSIWAVAEFVGRGNANWWLLAGLFAGLALLSKYTAAFLGAGLLLYLVTSRARWPWLRLWQVWAGALLALLAFLPNLWWNATNNWATLGFQGNRLGERGVYLGSALANFGDFVGGQALALGVFLFVFVVIGAVVFGKRCKLPGREHLALPLFTGLPILIFFALYTLRYRAEANWAIPAWPMLALVGAWAAVHIRPRHRFLRGLLAVLRRAQAPLGAILLALFYIQAVGHPFEVPAAADRTRDMRGWAALEQEVAGFAAREGTGWIVVGPWDYGLAGQLAIHGKWAGRELRVRGSNEPRRWSFLPPLPADVVAGPALVVVTAWGRPPSPPTSLFAEAELVGEARRLDGEEELERFYIYRASGPLPAMLDVLGQN